MNNAQQNHTNALIGESFKSTVYESVIGAIELETEILEDGSFATTLWVVYPDGMHDEVFTVAEAFEKLEV